MAEGSEEGEDFVADHGAEFAGGAGEGDEVGGEGVRGAGDGEGGEVKTGGGAEGVFEDSGAGGDHGLAAGGGAHLALVVGEAVLDGGFDGGVEVEGEAEKGGDEVAGDVVAGGAEAAGDDDDVGAADGFEDGFADDGAVGDGELAGDAKAEGEEGFAEESEVGVEGISEEEFGSGIDHFEAHGGASAGRWGRSSRLAGLGRNGFRGGRGRG